MSGLFTVVLTMCAAALVCSLVQTFVSDGSTKKIIGLVLGTFVICCMAVPIKNAVSSFSLSFEQGKVDSAEISTDDEAYSRTVIAQTEKNLENALVDILLQNNITVNSCDITLSESGNNGIIISSVCIYINKKEAENTNLISTITYDNFSITPNILTE